MRNTIFAAAAALAAAAAAPASAAGFDGPYAGLSLGYDMQSTQLGGARRDDSDGVAGGAFAGFQKSYGDLVFGGEAAVRYSTGDHERGGREMGYDWSWDLVARPGYQIAPGTAVFAMAGVTWADVEEPGLADGYRFGYVAGLGAETYVQRNVSVRLDWRHAWYDGYASGLAEREPSSDSVSVGVSYHW